MPALIINKSQVEPAGRCLSKPVRSLVEVEYGIGNAIYVCVVCGWMGFCMKGLGYRAVYYWSRHKATPGHQVTGENALVCYAVSKANRCMPSVACLGSGEDTTPRPLHVEVYQ